MNFQLVALYPKSLQITGTLYGLQLKRGMQIWYVSLNWIYRNSKRKMEISVVSLKQGLDCIFPSHDSLSPPKKEYH